MPITLTTVTGPILGPDGAAIAGATVNFVMARRDREGDALILPAPVTATTDEAGELSAELWANVEGYAGTWYEVRILYGAQGGRHISGRCNVPALGPVALADILETVPPDPTDDLTAKVNEARGYRDAAEEAAGQTADDREATAADRVATGQDRVATAADREQTGLDRAAAEGAAGAASGHAATASGAAGTATEAAGAATEAAGTATAAAEQTEADRAATGQDRTQTGVDATAAAASALSAAASAIASSRHEFTDDGSDVPAGGYPLATSTRAAGTLVRFYLAALAGDVGGSATVELLLNGAPITAPIAVTVGTPVNTALADIAAPAGSAILANVLATDGVTSLWMQVN